MSLELTDKESLIFDFIKKSIDFTGYPPSIREICASCDIKSTSTCHSYLNKIEKKGYIKRDSLKNRAIEIIKEDNDSTFLKKTPFVPILGDVTAGLPILAQEQIEESFPIPIDIAQRGNHFMLKVHGESMIEAGIYDGDKILVRQQNVCENGDIVVALIEDSATIKRFYKRNGYIELVPENSTMEPIIVKDCTILGRVIGLYREY